MNEGADLPMEFDPGSVPPNMGGGNALPVSDKNGYLVNIIESDYRQTTSGTGSALVLNLEILDGPNAGQTGNWTLNLGHSNAVTVRIAHQELSCICHAVGHLTALKNSSVLHNKPFRIVVVPQKVKAGEQDKGYTEVKTVLRADGSKLTDPPGGARSTGPAPPPPGPAPTAPMQQGGFPPAPQPGPPPGPPQPTQQWPPQQAAAPPMQQQPPQQWQQPQQPPAQQWPAQQPPMQQPGPPQQQAAPPWQVGPPPQ